MGKKDKEEKKHKKDKEEKKHKKEEKATKVSAPEGRKENGGRGVTATGIEEPIGTYSDGHPLDVVHYLEAKLILKPDRFTSVDSFRDFGKLVQRTAKNLKVGFITDPKIGLRPDVREIIFGDTPDFRLYNNAFILRRRVSYVDGFPVGDPEIVFKFRHPDEKKAAALDVRPNISGAYRIKFKAEALPLKEEIGGYRILYSHNCVFGLSQMHEADKTSMATLARVFPALSALKKDDTEKVSLVNEGIVEEVLLELGELDFGKGIVGKCNVALWRTRGEHKPLVGEFAYQCKFERKEEVHEKAKKLCEQFFITLQQDVKDWISLGTTKTGMVYRLKGNAPQGHE
jgi:hypothetical protein